MIRLSRQFLLSSRRPKPTALTPPPHPSPFPEPTTSHNPSTSLSLILQNLFHQFKKAISGLGGVVGSSHLSNSLLSGCEHRRSRVQVSAESWLHLLLINLASWSSGMIPALGTFILSKLQEAPRSNRGGAHFFSRIC